MYEHLVSRFNLQPGDYELWQRWERTRSQGVSWRDYLSVLCTPEVRNPFKALAIIALLTPRSAHMFALHELDLTLLSADALQFFAYQLEKFTKSQALGGTRRRYNDLIIKTLEVLGETEEQAVALFRLFSIVDPMDKQGTPEYYGYRPLGNLWISGVPEFWKREADRRMRDRIASEAQTPNDVPGVRSLLSSFAEEIERAHEQKGRPYSGHLLERQLNTIIFEQPQRIIHGYNPFRSSHVWYLLRNLGYSRMAKSLIKFVRSSERGDTAFKVRDDASLRSAEKMVDVLKDDTEVAEEIRDMIRTYTSSPEVREREHAMQESELAFHALC